MMHKAYKYVKGKLLKCEEILDYKCPKCKGILVINYGPGISYTRCVDCDYDEYDYD